MNKNIIYLALLLISILMLPSGSTQAANIGGGGGGTDSAQGWQHEYIDCVRFGPFGPWTDRTSQCDAANGSCTDQVCGCGETQLTLRTLNSLKKEQF